MFEILRRSPERPWRLATMPVAERPCSPHPRRESRSLVLRMRENRSSLSPAARSAFSTLALLFMAMMILPALKGYWLVPAYSLAAMAALTFALDRHSKSRPASETLELSPERVRHHDSTGRTVELPAFWLRVTAEGKTPADLRLFLRGRDGAVEVGSCLSLEERRQIAPLIAAALAQAREG